MFFTTFFCASLSFNAFESFLSWVVGNRKPFVFTSLFVLAINNKTARIGLSFKSFNFCFLTKIISKPLEQKASLRKVSPEKKKKNQYLSTFLYIIRKTARIGPMIKSSSLTKKILKTFRIESKSRRKVPAVK